MGNILDSKAETTSVMTPRYEVKLVVKRSEVLDSNYRLSSEAKDTFSVKSAARKMNVQYLDTKDKDIFQRKWSPRIRYVEGGDGLELTYKKRYEVVDGDIKAALEAAAQDGFGANNDIFEAEVDWGFKNQTLSIKRDEAYPNSMEQGRVLPLEDDAQHMLIKNAPETFKNEIDTALLSQARIYGPVMAERFTGTYDDDDLDIEVWPIREADHKGFEYFVVVSFKVKQHAKAVKRRQELEELLESKGWLLKEDSLMTTLIMERY
jgi:hypothetical protein